MKRRSQVQIQSILTWLLLSGPWWHRRSQVQIQSILTWLLLSGPWWHRRSQLQIQSILTWLFLSGPWWQRRSQYKLLSRVNISTAQKILLRSERSSIGDVLLTIFLFNLQAHSNGSPKQTQIKLVKKKDDRNHCNYNSSDVTKYYVSRQCVIFRMVQPWHMNSTSQSDTATRTKQTKEVLRHSLNKPAWYCDMD